MKLLRFAGASFCLAIGLLAAAGARAEYPDRMIRLVVTTAPGTSGDIVARLVAPKLAEKFKQTVIVENKPGANGNVAAMEVARSAPDGYTVLIVPSGTLVANLFLYPKASSVALSSLTPITRLVTNDFVVAVSSDLNVKTMPDFIKYVRSNPGKVTVGTSSVGSFPNLAAEMLKQMSGLDYLVVPFNGEAAAATATAGGHVNAVIAASSALDSVIDSGRVVRLANTGKQRNGEMPEVPTVAESGVADYSILGFVAVAVPSNVPADIQERLRGAFAEASKDQSIVQRLQTLRFVPAADSAEQIKEVITSERAKLDAVIRKMGGAIEK